MKSITLVLSTIILIVIAVNISEAQQSKFRDNSKKYKNRYKDQLNEEEKIKESWYHYVATETKDKKYYGRFFFPDTKQIISFEEFESKKYKIKNGYAKYWSDDGVLTREGTYRKNLMNDEWIYLYFSDSNKLQ